MMKCILTSKLREYLIFWKMSTNSASDGGKAFTVNKSSAHKNTSKYTGTVQSKQPNLQHEMKWDLLFDDIYT